MTLDSKPSRYSKRGDVGIESPVIKSTVVEILEGTEPAFKNRRRKYGL